MADRVGVAVIGCGFFAQYHLHAWQDLSQQGAELIAVCDIDAEKAKAAATKFNVPRWYTRLDDLLAAERPGLVDIVTRVETHKEQTLRTIAHGVPTIVQKPFAPTLADCREIVTAAKKTGVFLAVHENFRFQKPLRRIVELVQEGVVGTPSWCRVSFRTDYDIYRGQPYLLNEPRFVISDLGVHVCDLARVYLGEVEHVTAEIQCRNPEARGEDTATMMLKHARGAISVVECTYGAHRVPDIFPQTLVELEGTRGSIMLHPDYRLEIAANGDVRTERAEAELLSWAQRPWHVVQESVLATCSDILDALCQGRPAQTSGEDNFMTFAVCEAAYESAATGKTSQPQMLDQ